MLISTVIKPTRPKNISTTNRTLLILPKSGVMPKLEPTVENADTLSNSRSIDGMLGSNSNSAT